MSSISLTAIKCVHSLDKESKCNKCEVICPTDAIRATGKPLPVINTESCIGCGACDAICPNEALYLDDFKPKDFLVEFVDDKSSLISCHKNVPCIASLSVEYIVSLAIFKKEIILDIGYCDDCSIAHKCKTQILKNYEEATYLLSAMENKSDIRLDNICFEGDETQENQESNRRDFFNSITLGNVAKVNNYLEKEVKKATNELVEHTLEKEDIALLKKKVIPQKRKILFTAIKRVERPSQFHVVDANEVSFTSQKLLNEENCTACQMCYRLCPTGALTSDIMNSKIDFDPFLCVKCSICHDVCEPDAITLSSSYNIKEFFEPIVQNLISFNVSRCDECNMIFSTSKEEKVCSRCKEEGIKSSS
ncbi:MAG: energy-converting hydrogenase A subunit P [Sulfurimonas sp.]|jgi:energy-converting hydrogenase A subunit P